MTMAERSRTVGERAAGRACTGWAVQSGIVPVLMYRADDRLTLAVPMPGVEPEDIAVEVHADGRLTVEARQRSMLKGVKKTLIEEWTPGPYRRELRLPNPVDGELTNVTYRNGVLVVAMPLSARIRPGQLTMTRVGLAHGEREASHGHPIRPVPGPGTG